MWRQASKSVTNLPRQNEKLVIIILWLFIIAQSFALILLVINYNGILWQASTTFLLLHLKEL